MKSSESPALMSVGKAAKRLGVDRSTVYRWLFTGDIHAVKMNGRNYISDAEIERVREGRQ